MDEYTKDFLAEVNELTDSLEKTLIELEENRKDKDLITKIFRAMHTLKGSSGMFGFNVISEFTHNLETIYELLRDGKIEITTNLINVTFAAVDHIKSLLNDPELKNAKNKEENITLLDKIDEITDELGLREIIEAIEKEQKLAQEANKNITPLKTYRITFESPNDINILFLFGELQTMGTCHVIPVFSKVPTLGKLDHEKCYIYWEVFLATNLPVNEINDVFIFVEDPKVDIKKLADDDLYEDLRFVALIEKFVLTKTIIEDELNEITGQKTEVITKETTNDVAKTDEEPIKPKLSSNTEQELHETEPREKEPDAEEVTHEYISSQNFIKPEKEQAKPQQVESASDEKISSIRVSSDKIDDIMNLVSELITSQARLNLVSEQNKIPNLLSVTRSFQKLTRELRDKAFSLSLLPIESMLTRFHRLVRDLSKKFEKEIDFVTEGTETELDKTLIQNLGDPIMHIIRNSIDHGIESKEIRQELGKPVHGLLKLKAFYSGAHVYIQIIDDGAGINPVKVKEKAISKGLINSAAVYSHKDMLNMIFLPGLSTAQKLTDVSGRGVGMDVVKKKIEEVRGEVEIESEKDKGTTVTIKLPLTLSIIDGLLVNIAGIKYIIQLSVVQKIYRVKTSDLNEYNNLIVLEGKQVPFHFLRKEFETFGDMPDEMKIVVVAYEGRRIGLVVDEVFGEYQAVLKPLGKLYNHIEIISGGTILGDGTVALVMDTGKMIKSFSNEI